MPKKTKVGKQSRFYLYVEFLPAYQITRKDWTYNSNDEKGPEKAVFWLMKRVLNGTVKNKYAYAKLVDRELGKVLAVWTPDQGQMSWESFMQLKYSSANNERPYLKASVAFLPRAHKKREAYGLSPLLTLVGHAVDGKNGEDAAMLSIYKQIMEGKYAQDFRQAFIYDRQDIKVATLEYHGITFHSDSFKKRLMNAGNVELPSLIIEPISQLC